MARGKSHTLGLVSLLLLLVFVLVVLQFVFKVLLRTVSGFQDQDQVNSQPSPSSQVRQSQYVPDPNTNYLCRSPNGDGVPCPEGQFCDGTDQTCKSITAPALNTIMGYFS